MELLTPQGSISFISKGWGGRTNDKHVTANCGFLDNLLPGDIVLADRGFDIDEMVGMMCAEVKIPSFTRGRSQMCARDIESTRELAHLRIHVERVIGNLCAKYTILTGTLPICLVLPCESEGITFLDKMVTLCCALPNMCCVKACVFQVLSIRETELKPCVQLCGVCVIMELLLLYVHV